MSLASCLRRAKSSCWWIRSREHGGRAVQARHTGSVPRSAALRCLASAVASSCRTLTCCVWGPRTCCAALIFGRWRSGRSAMGATRARRDGLLESTQQLVHHPPAPPHAPHTHTREYLHLCVFVCVTHSALCQCECVPRVCLCVRVYDTTLTPAEAAAPAHSHVRMRTRGTALARPRDA